MSPASALLGEARRRAGLTQRRLASRAGTGQSVVARIERGRMEPTVGTLMRLLRACGFDLRMWLEPHDRGFEDLVDRHLSMRVEDRLRSVENVARFKAEVDGAR